MNLQLLYLEGTHLSPASLPLTVKEELGLQWCAGGSLYWLARTIYVHLITSATSSS